MAVGAVLWLGFLIWISALQFKDLNQTTSIPLFWQNLYLIGLYLWMALCLALTKKRRSDSLADWGFRVGWQFKLLPAFSAGLLHFAVLYAVGIGQGRIAWQNLTVPENWLLLLFISTFSAWALSGIEEVLFRACLWAVWRPTGLVSTLLIQALLFTCVHGESWQSGLFALNLCLAALLLGQLRLLSKDLGWCLGLHASWIWSVLCLSQFGLLASATGSAYNPLHENTTTWIWVCLNIILWRIGARTQFENVTNAAGSASVS
jgi:membrane protease YdiL (CAAX protease family)